MTSTSTGLCSLVELIGPGGVEPRTLGFGRKNGARPAARRVPFMRSGELRLLSIGSSSRITGMVFSAGKVTPLINELRARADFVILDSSPLLTLAGLVPPGTAFRRCARGRPARADQKGQSPGSAGPPEGPGRRARRGGK